MAHVSAFASQGGAPERDLEIVLHAHAFGIPCEQPMGHATKARPHKASHHSRRDKLAPGAPASHCGLRPFTACVQPSTAAPSRTPPVARGFNSRENVRPLPHAEGPPRGGQDCQTARDDGGDLWANSQPNRCAGAPQHARNAMPTCLIKQAQPLHMLSCTLAERHSRLILCCSDTGRKALKILGLDDPSSLAKHDLIIFLYAVGLVRARHNTSSFTRPSTLLSIVTNEAYPRTPRHLLPSYRHP
jgi:hypothetical protein